jgi:hypothetical protein
LRELQALNPPLPQTIRNNTPQAELRLIADMITDGWIVGSVLPPTSWPINAIFVERITDPGLNALENDKWPKTAKRVFELSTLKVIAALVASLVAIAVGVRTFLPPKQKPGTSGTPAPERATLDKTHSQETSSPTATPVPE